MRLGDILLREGVVDATRLAAALQHQVVYGGRLGTVLIELGFADQDQVAHGLAKLHGVPAALARHLARRDPAVAELMSLELVAQHSAFPLAYALAGGVERLVVCMRDPRDHSARKAISASVGIPVVVSVAPEIAIYYWMERAFGLPRPPRFVHARPGGTSPLPPSRSDTHRVAPREEDDENDEDDELSVEIEIDLDEEDMPDELQLVDLDHADVERDHRQYDNDSRHHRSILDLAHQDTAVIERLEASTDDGDGVLSAAETRAAIESGDHRDAVADALLAFLRGHFGAGLVLVVRDDLALGHRGFGGSLDATTVETIVVPLSAPSVLATAAHDRRPFRGTPPDHGRGVQRRFFKLFHTGAPPREVIAVPVLIRGRVVCLIYAHGAGGGALPEKATVALAALAEDTAAAFVRLIKARKPGRAPKA